MNVKAYLRGEDRHVGTARTVRRPAAVLHPVHYLPLRDTLRTTFENHVKPVPNA